MATYGVSDVHYYDSTMTGAPVMRDVAGSMLAIVKACLVDGFGNEAPQGHWEIPYAQTNKAAFRSTDPDSTGSCCWLEDHENAYARPWFFESMSGPGAGVNVFAANAPPYLSYPKKNNAVWALYADSRTFYLMSTLGSASPVVCSGLATGDAIPAIAGDRYYGFMQGHQTGIDYNHYLAELETLRVAAVFSRNAAHTSNASGFAKHAIFASTSTPHYSGGFSASVRPATPASFDTEISVYPMEMYEKKLPADNYVSVLRGWMPGVYAAGVLAPPLGVYTRVRGFPGRSFRCQRADMTAVTPAYLFFDLVGPWRDDGSLSIAGVISELKVPGAYQVQLLRQSDKQLLRSIWSDSEGRYQFNGLRAQKYTLIAFDHTQPRRNPIIVPDVEPS